MELKVGVKSGHTYIEYIVRSKDWTLGEIQPYSLIKTLFVDGGGKIKEHGGAPFSRSPLYILETFLEHGYLFLPLFLALSFVRVSLFHFLILFHGG